MPVAYPTGLRQPLRASRSRRQPAAFEWTQPRRGLGYAQPIGSGVPVLWDVQWRLTQDEAATFLRWFTEDLDRGLLEFEMPIRTEFGLSNYACQFLPDALLTAREEGALWTYTATIHARELVVPEPPPQESTVAFKTQTAIAGNGGLSAAGEFPWPGTSSDGDLGVLVVFAEPARTISASAGWTQIDTFVCSSGSAGARCTTFAREKVSGDTGVVASIDGGNGFIQGQFFVYEGQRPGNYFDTANGLTNQPSASPINFPSTEVEFVNVEVLLIAVKAATSWPWFALATYTPGNLTGSTTAANTGWSSGPRVAGNAIARARLGTEQNTGAVNASASAPGIYSTRIIALR
jgi:hypothetical protein